MINTIKLIFLSYKIITKKQDKMDTLYGWYSEKQYKQKTQNNDSPRSKGEKIYYVNENDEIVEITEIKRSNERSKFDDAIYLGIMKNFSHVTRYSAL